MSRCAAPPGGHCENCTHTHTHSVWLSLLNPSDRNKFICDTSSKQVLVYLSVSKIFMKPRWVIWFDSEVGGFRWFDSKDLGLTSQSPALLTLNQI